MSNYNERNPTLSFRVDRKEKNKLDREAEKKKTTVNDLAKDVLTKFLKGELIPAKDDQQKELTQLRIEKIKAEIEYLKIKNNFAINFNQPISRSASVHIKPEIIVETPNSVETIRSPYDESNKRLQCTDCGCLFTWNSRDNFIDQMGEFHRHLLSKHNRELNPIEKDVIMKLTYEGDSR